jgi:hypothetical protein
MARSGPSSDATSSSARVVVPSRVTVAAERPPATDPAAEILVAEVLAAAVRPLRIASDRHPLGRAVAALALVGALIVAIGGFFVLRNVIQAQQTAPLSTTIEDHPPVSWTSCGFDHEATELSPSCTVRPQ